MRIRFFFILFPFILLCAVSGISAFAGTRVENSTAAGKGPYETTPASGDNKARAYEDAVYSGNGITANIPDGWTAATDGKYVVFTAPEGDAKEFVRVRLFPLRSDARDAFMSFCKARARQIGGGEVRESDRNVEFPIGRSATGIFTQFDKKALFIIKHGDSAEAEALIDSVSLND